MTKNTQSPKQILHEVFKGYLSRSISGMKVKLRQMGQEINADDLIWFWISQGMIHGTKTQDDHFILKPKLDPKKRNKKVNKI